MALIVEDGSGVENANTYASIAYVQQYADARGIDIVVTEPHIITSMDFIEGLSFVGTKISGLQWPRNKAKINGVLVSGVPVELKNLLAEVSISVAGGLKINQPPSRLKSKVKISSLAIEYSDAQGGQFSSLSSKAQSLIGLLTVSASTHLIGVRG